jgi:hypothetical protein
LATIDAEQYYEQTYGGNKWIKKLSTQNTTHLL